MKHSLFNSRRFDAIPGRAANPAYAVKLHTNTLIPALLILLRTLGFSQMANADSYTFSATGSGISAQGVFLVSNTGPLGASTVTGISGSFSDTTNGFSGAITGLEFAPSPTLSTPPAPPNTFTAPAFTDAGFSYDDLFWPAADSPAVCADALIFQ